MPWLVSVRGLVLEIARREADVAGDLVVGRALVGVLAVAQSDRALVGERAAGLILKVARREVDDAASVVVRRALIGIPAVSERDRALVGDVAAVWF